jgi:hypothetical protein
MTSSHLVVCLGLAFGLGVSAPQKGPATSRRATGSFDITMKPLGSATAEPTLGRMSADKQYHGDLEAAAKGEMLTATTDVKNSAVYVAIERVTGTLHGKRGSFILHHTGVMSRGEQHLTIAVVPDSGTDQLVGLTGTMSIDIAPDGKHSYTFEYTLP